MQGKWSPPTGVGGRGWADDGNEHSKHAEYPSPPQRKVASPILVEVAAGMNSVLQNSHPPGTSELAHLETRSLVSRDVLS